MTYQQRLTDSAAAQIREEFQKTAALGDLSTGDTFRFQSGSEIVFRVCGPASVPGSVRVAVAALGDIPGGAIEATTRVIPEGAE